MRRGSRLSSSPDSGWSHARATSGAGTVSLSRPTRPPAQLRRLAGKNRLADIEAELEAVRAEVETKRDMVTAAEAEVAEAAMAETQTRALSRERQREADFARDRHSAAERDAGRNAARLSALGEARARLTARDEATGAHAEAEGALAGLPSSAETETQLAAVRGQIESDRVQLAEVRARAHAIAREGEMAIRRLTTIAHDRESWSTRRDGAVRNCPSSKNASPKRELSAPPWRMLPPCFPTSAPP